MGKVYTHFQTERVQKPYPLWWLRAAWGGSTSGGLPSWKAALNVSGQKVVYSDFVYIQHLCISMMSDVYNRV